MGHFEEPAISVEEVPGIPFEALPQIHPTPLTIDQLLRGRVALSGDSPVVAYPHSGIDYTDYTPRQIDHYAYFAGLHYRERMPQRSSSADKPRVVGLLGPSNMDYVVSMFALSKIGHTVLYLSPRISKEAHRSLLKRTGATDLLIHESFRELATALQDEVEGLQVLPIADVSIYEQTLPEDVDTRMDQALDPEKETEYPAWIIHSSGSTSLPKPVYLFHRAVLNNYRVNNIPMKGFVTMPLYHSHGVATLCKAIYSGLQVHLYNANLPLATQHLVGTLEKYHFDIFHGVPYSLKLLAETDHAIDLLARCKIVMYGGSACPDNLGNLLTERGVTLVSHYGTTETGQLMSSERPRNDKLWNWVRPSAKSRPYIRFEDRGSGLLEIICLPGWPGKVMTNRDDGSYATRDLFVKHPEMEAYKYFSRLDDTLTLVNGEKANPLLVEGLVRQRGEVREAVVVGAARSQLGLLLFPSASGAELSRDALLDRIWPLVEKAHQEMPNYAHLSRDMVKVMPADAQYAATDKGTIIRQAIYKQYASDIESMYDEDQDREGDLDISGEELQTFLKQQVKEILDIPEERLTLDADFFKLGMDSLQASQLRSTILKRIKLNGGKLGLNIAFDSPSIRALAAKLEAVANGEEEKAVSVEEEMKSLIAKYGTFSTGSKLQARAPEQSSKHSVLVTGATGSLGAHMVSILAQDDGVERIYCLVRASSPQNAQERVYRSMQDRKVFSSMTPDQLAKITSLPSDLTSPTLGLDTATYDEIAGAITAVIHSAWSVNFNLRLQSFTDCISGTRHLIDLCLRSTHRASFSFCSSVSTATGSPATAPIPEALPEKFSYAQNIGYAQAKLVTEHVTTNAAAQTGLRARVLRIGQVCGDSRAGVWPATEAHPLIVRSALSTGALPAVDETPRWLPADTVARTVVELALPADVPAGQVFNVINPRTFHWTRDLLPMLRRAGLKFDEVSPAEWVRRLRDSNPDVAVNPPYKLVEFFATRYGGQGKKAMPEWETARTGANSESFRAAPVMDQGLVEKMLRYWREECWNKDGKNA